MSIPLVSVIIPLYNYGKYIEWCVQSVLNQTYTNFEIIIVDDCSADNSFNLANKFSCDKIRVIKLDTNSGYSKAKNEGIILSKGEYITTIDADDMLTKTSIECRVAAALKNNVPFVHANAINVIGDLSLERCYRIRKNIDRTICVIHAQTVLMARWVYKKFGLYDESLRSRSDKEMWWRLFGDGCKSEKNIRKIKINNDVAYYRLHSDSMMSYRHRNKRYNKIVTKQLSDSYRMRKEEGITSLNTRFLEK